MLPISTVNKGGFHQMLNPGTNFPCRNHFTNIAIPELLAQRLEAVLRAIFQMVIFLILLPPLTCGHQQQEILT